MARGPTDSSHAYRPEVRLPGTALLRVERPERRQDLASCLWWLQEG